LERFILRQNQYHHVIKIPSSYEVLDLSASHDIEGDNPYTIGKYNEKRANMYRTESYVNSGRVIHMGIDIGAPAGTEIRAFYEGEVLYAKNNDLEQDYGPTLVTKHIINGKELFALWGHLDLKTLTESPAGRKFQPGEVIGYVGDRDVNGGWTPHLHFQLSIEDPGEANMPGVVSEADREEALVKYPDPRMVLGKIY